MRSVFLAITVAALTATTLSGQTAVGSYLGLNVTTFGGASAEGAAWSSRASAMVGGLVEHRFGGGLLRTGMFYSKRGAEHRDTVTSHFNVSYIEVPALVGFEFPIDNPSVHPIFFGGIQAGFNTGCRLEDTHGSARSSIGCGDSSVGLDIAGLDVAWLLGGGLTVAVGHGLVTADVHYTYGLTDVAKDIPDQKNRGITFGIGYLRRLGR